MLALSCRPQPGRGWAEGLELEWGKEGWMDTVRALADPAPDLVLAADCCYVDQVWARASAGWVMAPPGLGQAVVLGT